MFWRIRENISGFGGKRGIGVISTLPKCTNSKVIYTVHLK